MFLLPCIFVYFHEISGLYPGPSQPLDFIHFPVTTTRPQLQPCLKNLLTYIVKCHLYGIFFFSLVCYELGNYIIMSDFPKHSDKGSVDLLCFVGAVLFDINCLWLISWTLM